MDLESSSRKRSKHKRSDDKEREHSSRKKHKHDRDDPSRKKHKHKRDKHSTGGVQIVDDDPDDEDMWVEKNIDMDGEKVSNRSFKNIVYLNS